MSKKLMRMKKYKTVEEFLNDLNNDKKSQVLKLREYIFETEPDLTELIKWNAPNYVYNGEDRITFNLVNKEGLVKVVFHMGTMRKEDKKAIPVMNDEFSLIQWASNIRGYITFSDYEDVISKEKALKHLIPRWLSVTK